jgi:Antitoxin of toxin-antitoxin, RelE / RelB, TA system
MTLPRGLAVAGFEPTHQFKAREARDNWRQILDRAESGVVSVVRRGAPVVVAPRDVMARALASLYPFNVQVSVGPSQVSMWLEGMPVHAVGATYEEAEENFLDALLDYAELWVRELKSAPNHRDNEGLVTQVLMYGEDRDELRSVVFGDE